MRFLKPVGNLVPSACPSCREAKLATPTGHRHALEFTLLGHDHRSSGTSRVVPSSKRLILRSYGVQRDEPEHRSQKPRSLRLGLLGKFTKGS